MIDFKETETTVGYVETDSGGILITDLLWDHPSTSQQKIAEDLDLGRVKIPIKAVLRNNKRQIIIELDDAILLEDGDDTVKITPP